MKDNDGKTALMYAAEPNLIPFGRKQENELILSGNTLNFRELIKAKADLEVQDKHGRTALMYAAKSGNTEVVRELIKAGADLEVKDNSGRTALMYAAGNKWVAGKLIKAKANLEMKDKYGKTALMYAVESGNTEVIQLLKAVRILMTAIRNKDTRLAMAPIESRANIKQKGKYGITAQMLGMWDGNTKVAIANMKDPKLAKANFEAKDENLRTVIMLAIINEDTKVALALIESRMVPIDEQDKHGKTALMYAAKFGQTEVVKALVDAGARLDLVDKYGKTALMLANMVKKTEVVELLAVKARKVQSQPLLLSRPLVVHAMHPEEDQKIPPKSGPSSKR